jgi:2-oxoglutarate dehydrogenase E2 component (dihydrolipoamide succinyltransferase)
MPTKILVPELGESIVEATVASWLKKQGDHVSVGEALVELETDKVDLEVGAPQDGVLAQIEVEAGKDVKVGDVLGIIEDQPASTGKPPESAEGGDARTEARPSKPDAEAETLDQQPQREAVSADGEVATAAALSPERVTPVARRLAEEHGLDLNQLTGTGASKRVTREDVERYLRSQDDSGQGASAQDVASTRERTPQEMDQPSASQPEARPAAEPSAGEPSAGRDRREERLRMSRRRRTIAQRLVEAQQTTAMLTTFNDVDMTSVMELRKRRREAFLEKHGVKLGIMSFFVKATIGALKDFPRLNAEIQGDEIVLKHYYDIGIAIGAEEGLVVPVLRDADKMSFAEIEKAINELVKKSQEGSLTIEDLRGGTFSITNGGIYGSLLSTPILNPPQSGILGLHRIEDRPVARDGQVIIRQMMYTALSYDHRIVDGREAVQFLARVKELVEDPEALLLEG